MDLQSFVDNKNRLIVKLPSLIDLKNGTNLKESVTKLVDNSAQDHEVYVLDLSELEFIDSLGLGILVGIQRKISGYNKKLFFLNPKESIRRVFEVTQLQRVFTVIEEE